MSGHSHWAGIKYKKSIEDKKRGKIFSKLARQISVAAKEKGGDPESNPVLRMAIDKAKSVNMPKENIERAIKRGTGELDGEKLESVIFEAYGPNNIAIIVEGITDNKNRALGEIKKIFNDHNGKMAGEGSVRWMFERRGVIVTSFDNQAPMTESKEDLEMKVIEAGAEDIYWHDPLLEIYTKPEELEKVKKNLEKENFKIDSASLDWMAKEEILIEEKDKEKIEKLFEALDENDAVQDIYSNLRI